MEQIAAACGICRAPENILPHEADAGPQSRIVAIGHFGNFELYARFGQFCARLTNAPTTYRALKQPELNRLLQCCAKDRAASFLSGARTAPRCKAAMNDTSFILGLLADQSSAAGLRMPFLGHDCATSTAPAIFALRYDCALHTAICFRVGLAKWRIEVGDEIPTHENGAPRTSEDIMRDVNRAFEKAVRRDPANWFWVHRRWKDENKA